MSAAVMPAPPPAARPSPHRFTAAEFNRMGDMGWFEGRRAFLIDGVILENGPMDPPHAVAIMLATEVLRAVVAAGWVVRAQMPLHLDEYNDPMPDLAVVRGGPRDFLSRHPTTASLVVEVADSSLAVDLTEKAERYATAGVPDYWVIDLDGRRVIVFRDPAPLPAGLGATAYRTRLEFGPASSLAPLAAPNAAVKVADLLP